MRRLNNSTGFTILELLFFIVIGSALILIPFRILQGRNADVQFLDATRTIQAVMQREYNNTLSGVNAGNPNCRYVDPPGDYDFSGSQPNDGTCIYLGSVMEFGQISTSSVGDEERREMHVYPIVARNMTLTSDLRQELNDCMSSLASDRSESRKLLYCLEPHKKQVDDGTSSFVDEFTSITIPWGVEVFDTGPYNANGLAYFKDPRYSRVMPVGYVDGYTDYNDFDAYDTTSQHEVVVDVEYSGYLCFWIPEDETSTARVGLGFGSRQEVVELTYDSTNCIP